MHLAIRVTVLPGTSIEDAATEMVAFAQRHGLCVETTFNDKWILARPSTTPEEIVRRYHDEQQMRRP